MAGSRCVSQRGGSSPCPWVHFGERQPSQRGCTPFLVAPVRGMWGSCPGAVGAGGCSLRGRSVPAAPRVPRPRAGEPVAQHGGSGSCWQRFLVSVSKGSVIKIAAAGMVQLQKLACVGLLAGCSHHPSLPGRRWWGTGAGAPWAPVRGTMDTGSAQGSNSALKQPQGLCRTHHGRWPRTPMCWEPLYFWQRDGVAASPASRVGRQQESPRSWRLLPRCGQISNTKASQPEGCT